MPTRIVLLGAGHAHHHALAHLHEYANSGCAVTLITDGPFWYSGMVTGVLGGCYAPEDGQIDVGNLTIRGGGNFICGRASAIDAEQQVVHLADGRVVPYDFLSLGLGSQAQVDMPQSNLTRSFAVKPLGRLWDLRLLIEQLVAERGSEPVRVVVIGGGASACEAAANAHALISSRGGCAEVVLIAGHGWLADLPARARRLLAEDFARRGLRVEHAQALGCTAEGVEIPGRAAIPHDAVVFATGLQPSPLAATSGLLVDGQGALLVDDRLCSLGDPRIFGGGDCISITGHPLPRLGVFAVRQGPVLHHNLIAAATGAGLRSYRPQRRWLSILNLGNRMGLAMWGPFSWYGHFAWLLKDRIDRAFIRRYRA